VSDHATRRDANVKDTLDGIDAAIEGYIEWDGDSNDAMEWFASEPPGGQTLISAASDVITNAVVSVQIRDGIDGDVVAAPEFEWTWPTPKLRHIRMVRGQAWRKYAHRIGLLWSPSCGYTGLPFGFRRRTR
jgi:hypothetical protein